VAEVELEHDSLLELAQRLQRADLRRHLRDGLRTGRVVKALSGVPPHRIWKDADLEAKDIGWLGDRLPIPRFLREIPDPPIVLYYRGGIECLSAPAVAIVGARRCSARGRELAREMACMLADHGLVVVSGLAAGVDGAAHRGALESGRARSTVAVLGHGFGRIYPASHRTLAAKIELAHGALVTEYPPLTPPARWRFPERNRLISGLVRAVVLIEASTRSGSLITARMALEQGRDVFAVPGGAGDPLYGGSHRLIREGAALVETPADVLEELGRDAVHATGKAPEPVPADLQMIHAVLGAQPRDADEIAAATGAAVTGVNAALVRLELEGFVRQLPDGYIRVPFR